MVINGLSIFLITTEKCYKNFVIDEITVYGGAVILWSQKIFQLASGDLEIRAACIQ